MTVLDEATWRARADAHRDRVRALTAPHRERAARGEKHPVLDFLFTYYSHRPAHLERWHAGPGVVLAGAAERLAWRGYTRAADVPGGVLVDPAVLGDGLRRTATFVRDLLVATRSRPAQLACFGLHEWAMVYRARDVRHPVPLRLGAAGADAVVESLPLRCSHHDAFRFFTDAARPRNATVPTREGQVATEQPGCVHATMDLYKWAYKLAPASPSDLVADCLELAADARDLDMRASPYDLAAHGYEPVRIETAEGRAAYARVQAALARRAALHRDRIVELCDVLLGAAGKPEGEHGA